MIMRCSIESTTQLKYDNPYHRKKAMATNYVDLLWENTGTQFPSPVNLA